MKIHYYKFIILIVGVALFSYKNNPSGSSEGSEKIVKWEHLSSLHRDLPFADVGEQVSALILDIDKDGRNDFIIAGWGKPSMVWFKRTEDGWEKYLIDEYTEYIEAGGDFADIDGDGDLDIVQGGDWRTLKEVWWWENPSPDFDPKKPWKRYLVKNSDEGGKGHHDQIFGDFDDDGQEELVFWNTEVCKLFIAEIPDDPRNAPAWDLHLIQQFETPEKGKYEGLAKGDIDNDGKLDIVGGGHWFKHIEGYQFETKVIDSDYYGSRSAIGDLIEGGRPEVVLSSGDHVNSLNIYEWNGTTWNKRILKEKVIHGHTLQVEDINGDGNLDIFTAEMAQWRGAENPDAKGWIFYGDGNGKFTESIISEGICHHESKIGDLDGDGDLDILGKPFMWNDSPLVIWLNKSNKKNDKPLATKTKSSVIFLSQKIDGPAENWYGPFSEGSAVFDVDNDGILDITAGPNWYKGPEFNKHPLRNVKTYGEFISNSGDHEWDVNEDGWIDIVSNGWFDDQNIYWYEHPGNTNGPWKKHLVAKSKDTEAILFEDLDGDGDPDIVPNHWTPVNLYWMELKDGKFIKHEIGKHGDKHGLGIGDLNRDGRKDIITTQGWYEAPDNYTVESWIWHPDYKIDVAASVPMLVYDVNADGRNDIIYGAAHDYGLFWLENKERMSWEKHTIDESWSQVHCLVLEDINEDGNLDLITGKRLRGHSGKDPGSSEPLGIYWYEIDRSEISFTKHTVAYNALIGTGMEINIKDIDEDNDKDIIVSGKSGLFLLENMKYFNKKIEKIKRTNL